MIFKIDDCDKEILTKHSFWFHKSSGYMATKINGKFTPLHRLLMGFPDGYVDHINRNRLDNRRCNLRVVDCTGNIINRGIQKNNKSGHPGVFWYSKNSCWIVGISKPRIYLGSYRIYEDAVYVRDCFASFIYEKYANIKERL